MADVKISELAKTVGVSVDKLLAQIKEAGLPHLQPDELISNDDKNALLVFLRRSHGDREATNAAPKKITLKRKTIGTLKSSSNHGRGKTVNVEVRDLALIVFLLNASFHDQLFVNNQLVSNLIDLIFGLSF